jgi:hypothetical protein
VLVWQANPVTTDGAGAFTLPVRIGPEYAPEGEVHLTATDTQSDLRLEAVYRITAPPAPGISADPAVVAVGGTVSV